MERLEEWRVAVDVHQAVLADVAGSKGQKAGRADFATLGDEDDTVAIADSEAASGVAAHDLLAGHAFGAHGVESHAAIGGGLGGCNDEGCGLGRLVSPVHHALAFVR